MRILTESAGRLNAKYKSVHAATATEIQKQSHVVKRKAGTGVLHIAFSVCLFGKGVFQKLRMHVKKKEMNITKESPFAVVLVGKAISGLL